MELFGMYDKGGKKHYPESMRNRTLVESQALSQLLRVSRMFESLKNIGTVLKI
jgi:hypothetical protein